MARNMEAYNAYRAKAREENPFMIYRKEADGTWYRMMHTSDWQEYIEDMKETFGRDKVYRAKDRRTNKIVFEG